LTDPEEICVVCQALLDEHHQASCQMCGGKFHQPWSVDAQVPQCGRIASHEEALALVFLCQNCYESMQEET
jgi:hypothetical protein